MPLLDPAMSDKLGTLQALDDAIAFRFGRLQQPCLDCMGRNRCTDHNFDQHLLKVYKARYAAACAEALAATDPDIGKLMQAGDMPPTAAMLRAAVSARLREAAASGPVVIELDDQTVVIELDGQPLVEHALHASG